ncbi:MAG: PDZ domain-containing protein [Gammaproteobacteria bacterium]|nr:PDZ domain-containing protein [Gammaproteobacteria bacterium]
MSRQLILIGLALAVGITSGIYATRDGGDRPAPGATAPAPLDNAFDAANATAPGTLDTGDIDTMRRMLEDEIRARRALERRLLELGRQVEALQRDAGGEARTNDIAAATDDPAQADGDPREAGWFDTQALIDSGMDDTLAGELRVFYEQIEMERLYLRDQSLREQWDRDQYRAALDEIGEREAALKQRLGEQGYDAYLYASGQSNRVAVTSVLASAPAGQAGIEAGDHILRYDNQRIYNWFELREATAGGNVGDTVAVEVDRDGQTLQFYLARGPMGIRMNSLSVAP